MNEAEQDAYAAKVELTMSDAAVAASMTRHLAAIETMVCGRPGNLATEREPLFMAGMRLTPAELDILVCATARDGRDVVYVHFDADRPDEPKGIAVVRPLGETVALHPACRLWSPAGPGRAVIVPLGDDEGQFSFRAGQGLRQAANRPADSLEGGFKRGDAKMRRLALSDEAGEAVRSTSRLTTACTGPGRLESRREPIAA